MVLTHGPHPLILTPYPWLHPNPCSYHLTPGPYPQPWSLSMPHSISLAPPLSPASTPSPTPGLYAQPWTPPLLWGHSPTPSSHSICGPTLAPCSYLKPLYPPITSMLTLGPHPCPQPTPTPLAPRGSGGGCLRVLGARNERV